MLYRLLWFTAKQKMTMFEIYDLILFDRELMCFKITALRQMTIITKVSVL